MVRVVLYLFLAIVLITLLRAVAGVVGKGFAALFALASSERPEAPDGQPRLAGDLKRDPVCGVYVSVETSVKRTVAGQVFYFCSAACSEKYKG